MSEQRANGRGGVFRRLFQRASAGAPSASASSEIGYQADAGLAGWSALISAVHETNPDLQWPQALNVFDKMRREDPQVKSVMRAVTLPIMRTEWMIDGAGCRPEVVEHIAADLGLPVKGQSYTAPLRTKDRFSWKDHLRLALLELIYGHSYFEQVYDQSTGSTHLAKLAWRPPRTIADIEVAPDGGLLAIKQYGRAGKADVRIPVDRLVAYVHEREGANWIGESLLRSAYKMWLLKDRVLRIQALTAERNGLGLPVFTASTPPETASFEEAVEWMDKEIARGLKIAKAARAGDTVGASLASGSKLEFVGVTGKVPDLDKPIRYYDEQIARAVLAHFLNLGTETGSWALGSTFATFFTDNLNAVAQQLAEVFNQHVIEDLVDYNWGPNEPAPRLVPAAIGEQQPVTAEAIKSLIDSGAIKADEPLEVYLREKFGLPVKDTSEADDEPASATDAEQARFAAETIQKAYLGVGKVIDVAEARDLARRAGADLIGQAPPDSVPPAAANPADDPSAEEAAA